MLALGKAKSYPQKMVEEVLKFNKFAVTPGIDPNFKIKYPIFIKTAKKQVC